MLNVTIVMPWRQRAHLIETAKARLAALDYDPARLRFVLFENDSTDGTDILLRDWAALDSRITFGKRDMGTPLYGSIVHPVRFRMLATAFNWAMSLVDLAWSDRVLMLPCDIDFSPDLLSRLIAHDLPLIAPFVFKADTRRFYDIWAFSRDGQDFRAFRERDTAQIYGVSPVPLDTAGGTMLIHADALRAGVRYLPANVDRGFCETARAKGFTVWGDPATRVYHE